MKLLLILFVAVAALAESPEGKFCSAKSINSFPIGFKKCHKNEPRRKLLECCSYILN